MATLLARMLWLEKITTEGPCKVNSDNHLNASVTMNGARNKSSQFNMQYRRINSFKISSKNFIEITAHKGLALLYVFVY